MGSAPHPGEPACGQDGVTRSGGQGEAPAPTAFALVWSVDAGTRPTRRVCVCVVAPVVSDSATPRTADRQAPLSTCLSRQEDCSGMPCPPPGDLLDPGIRPVSLMSPVLAGGFFTGKPTYIGGRRSALLSLPVQGQISSRNTLTDTPRVSVTNDLGTHASVRVIPHRQLATHHSQVLQAPRILSVCSWPPCLPSAGCPFFSQLPKPGPGITPLTLNPHGSASEPCGVHLQRCPRGLSPLSSPWCPPGPGLHQVPAFRPLPHCLAHPPDFSPLYVLLQCHALAWHLWWWFIVVQSLSCV